MPKTKTKETMILRWPREPTHAHREYVYVYKYTHARERERGGERERMRERERTKGEGHMRGGGCHALEGGGVMNSASGVCVRAHSLTHVCDYAHTLHVKD
jgi:hypothetical protein